MTPHWQELAFNFNDSEAPKGFRRYVTGLSGWTYGGDTVCIQYFLHGEPIGECSWVAPRFVPPVGDSADIRDPEDRTLQTRKIVGRRWDHGSYGGLGDGQTFISLDVE